MKEIQYKESGSNVPEKEEIRSLLAANEWEQIQERSQHLPPEFFIDCLLDFDRDEMVLLFRALHRNVQKEVFSKLSVEEQNHLFRELTNKETKQLLETIPPDDRTALLEELPAEITERTLHLLEEDELDIARELLGYPEESVGRLMTPDFVAVHPDWTAERTLNHVRSLGGEPESITTLFVTDREGKLLDDLRLRRVINADPESKLEKLMDEIFISLQAEVDRETAVHTMDRYGLSHLPVVDSNNQLLGIVTADDILTIAEEEASEDFHRLGGSEPLEQPYFDLSIMEISWKRVGWLLLLFLGGTLTSSVIGAFENQLNKVIILSFFIPLLIGTGGNAGAQSVSTIIRALALNEVEWSDIFRVIVREFLTGLTVGSILGVLGFFFVMFFWQAPSSVSLVVALTLPVICTWANVVAGIVPIIADQIGIDPTVISAPLITTVVDATGLIIYFSLAVWILDL